MSKLDELYEELHPDLRDMPDGMREGLEHIMRAILKLKYENTLQVGGLGKFPPKYTQKELDSKLTELQCKWEDWLKTLFYHTKTPKIDEDNRFVLK